MTTIPRIVIVFGALQGVLALCGLLFMHAPSHTVPLARPSPTPFLALPFLGGLVAITPAAGSVDATGAIVIGLLAGMVCNSIVLPLERTGLDNTLDVFACHGCGGMLGAILTASSPRSSSTPRARTACCRATQSRC